MATEVPNAKTTDRGLQNRRFRWAPVRFTRDESGATVIEFAILAPIFIAMLFMILETGAIYWVDRMLQSYASDVARWSRTGYLADVKDTDADGNEIVRKEDLCEDRMVGLFFDCSKIETFLDVRQTSDIEPLTDGSGNLDASKFKVDPGPSGSVNIVRVFYEFPRIFGVPVSPTGVPMDNGDVQLYGAAGFVTE